MERLPRHIRAIHEEGPFIDEAGSEYVAITVEFAWWYKPIYWLFRLLSRPYDPEAEK